MIGRSGLSQTVNFTFIKDSVTSYTLAVFCYRHYNVNQVEHFLICEHKNIWQHFLNETVGSIRSSILFVIKPVYIHRPYKKNRSEGAVENEVPGLIETASDALLLQRGAMEMRSSSDKN